MWYSINMRAAMCLAALAAFTSCKKDESGSNNNNTNTRTLGLSGNDTISKVPKNLSFSALGSKTGTSQGSLPSSADLTPYLPPVGDQGQFGTCVAWATAYNCKTSLEAIKFNLTTAQLASPSFQLSPKDLFIAIPDNSGKGADNCGGADFVPALQTVLDRGVATLAVAPYTGLGDCHQSQTQAAWTADAAKHKIERFRRIDVSTDIAASIIKVKTELANKVPVVIGAKLGDNFMQWNNDQVISSASSFDNVGQHAYHALMICGYDDSKGPRGAYRVINSWANTWGDGGFIWIDYNYMHNGFSFNNNFFVASNDAQKPAPDVDPAPNTTGVDLLSWVFSDENIGTPSAPTYRKMIYNVYNVGNQTAAASTRWSYAYVYYNAYDAEDFGVAFVDQLNPSAPTSGSFACNSTTGICELGSNIPGESGLAQNFGVGNVALFRQYNMPTDLTGDYYLVFVADLTDKFQENDEDNNIFYTTDQDPVYFEDGEAGRRAFDQGRAATSIRAFNFKNLIPQSKKLTSFAHKYRTAVKPGRTNAYSPEEIKGLLKHHAKTGLLQRKMDECRARQQREAMAAVGTVSHVD